MGKRVLKITFIFILVLSMIFSLNCVTAFANESEPGTGEDNQGYIYKYTKYYQRSPHKYYNPYETSDGYVAAIYALEKSETEYEKVYCCDLKTSVVEGKKYKRINLEDAEYYSSDQAKHIRAIVEKSYPFISYEQMLANMQGNCTFKGELDKGQLLTAIQLSIWKYANSEAGNAYYTNTAVSPISGNNIIEPITEYYAKGSGKKNPEVDNNIKEIIKYLTELPPSSATNGSTIVINDVKYQVYKESANLEEGTVNLKVTVILNASVNNTESDISIKVGDSSQNVVPNQSKYVFNLDGVKIGDKIDVILSGTQQLDTGVYFYEPEGGRDSSQCFVGVASGETPVYASTDFTINPEWTQLKLTKHAMVNGVETQIPVKGAEFNLYWKNSTEDENDDIIIAENLATDENGILTADVLGDSDEYYFKEISAPYVFAEDKVTKWKSGETVYNTGIFDKELLKVDNSSESQPLSGAMFKLSWIPAGSDNPVDITPANGIVSGTDGKISLSGLLPGDYVLTEIKAPLGYELPKGEAAETKFTIAIPIAKTEPALDGQEIKIINKPSSVTIPVIKYVEKRGLSPGQQNFIFKLVLTEENGKFVENAEPVELTIPTGGVGKYIDSFNLSGLKAKSATEDGKYVYTLYEYIPENTGRWIYDKSEYKITLTVKCDDGSIDYVVEKKVESSDVQQGAEGTNYVPTDETIEINGISAPAAPFTNLYDHPYYPPVPPPDPDPEPDPDPDPEPLPDPDVPLDDTPDEPAIIEDEDTPLDEIPKTGDDSNLPLWIALLFVSAIGTGGAAYSGRRKDQA